MRFGNGRIALGDISGGILASGIVPFERVIRSWQDTNTGALVTLNTGLATVCSLALTGLVTGDYLICSGVVQGTKATGGTLHLRLAKTAGAGTLSSEITGLDCAALRTQGIVDGVISQDRLFALLKCTASGDVTLSLRGLVSAGTHAIASGDAYLGALVLVGA
jgi:hypothetical protein